MDSSQAPLLNPQQEKEWASLRRHLEWAEGFSLIFIFSSEKAVVNTFMERLNAIFMFRSARLERVGREQFTDLSEGILSMIRTPSPLYDHMSSPLWIELHDAMDESSLRECSNLLERLNEHRELLRKNLNRPLVLILPGALRGEVKIKAPDLWSIRDYSITPERFITPDRGETERFA